MKTKAVSVSLERITTAVGDIENFHALVDESMGQMEQDDLDTDVLSQRLDVAVKALTYLETVALDLLDKAEKWDQLKALLADS